ncbi:MAG: hypothetical protein IJ149_03085 [Oscillospiraceae bacterium]|nr:hypothetical protein [Oscillospiraceae bacterium]
MRKLIRAAAAGLLSLCCLLSPGDAGAYSVSKELLSREYDTGAFEEEVTRWLDEYNKLSPFTVQGRITLSEGFFMPVWALDNETLTAKANDYDIYVPVICNGDVIALAGTISYEGIRKPTQIYPLSQRADLDIDDHPVAFYRVQDQSSDFYGGYSAEMNIFSVDKQRTELVYFDLVGDYGDPVRAERERASLPSRPAYRQAARYSKVSSSSRSIYSFDYEYKGSHTVESGNSYLIRTKSGKSLSFDGRRARFTSGSGSTFILKSSNDGTFFISPESTPEKCISFSGTKSFCIELSYYDGYCYSVSRHGKQHTKSFADTDGALMLRRADDPAVWDPDMDMLIEKT